MPSVVATPVDPKILIAESVKKVTALATLPETTLKIMRIVEDPKSTAAQLQKIISFDPALVTRILKVVNSAFYGLPGQIASIERAIVLLGMTGVKNIAVAASLGQMFRGGKLCDGYTAKDLWQHCVAVGVTARELARQMKWPIVEEAFLAGMVHDVGLLVSMQLCPEVLKNICDRVKTGGEDFCAVERELNNGVDHQALGAALAAAWKFPKAIQRVVARHHEPIADLDPAADELTNQVIHLVYIADTLVAHHNIGFPLTAANQPLDESLAADLHVEWAAIEATTARLPALMQAAELLM